jgi:hypothetical protein
MKKIMVSVVTVLMIFAVAAVASADNNCKVYLDTMGNGGNFNLHEYMNLAGTTDKDFDTSLTCAGFEYLMDRIQLGAEYSSGEFSAEGDKADLTLYKLNIGYRVLDKDAFQMDMKGGYEDFSMDLDGVKIEYNGVFIGIDASYQFKDSSLEASIGYCPNAGVKEDGESMDGTDNSITDYRLKYTYFINAHWGASLGYRNFKAETKTDVMKLEETISGFTLGGTYKF